MSQPSEPTQRSQSRAEAGSATTRFSIKSLLVITAMVAATAFCTGYLWRAAMSDGEGTEIGQFAIVAAMVPTVFLAGASLFFKLAGKFID